MPGKTSISLFLTRLLFSPMYKSTFYNLKIGPTNRSQLIHGSKTEIKKSSGQIFVFQENSHPDVRKTHFLASK